MSLFSCLLLYMTHKLVFGQTYGDIRLVDGKNSAIGRLEVYLGSWRTVCDYMFDDADATVACRQLGFRRGVTLGSIVPDGSSSTMLYDVKCSGHENRLISCSYSSASCGNSRDVGVACLNGVNGGWSSWHSWGSCSNTCGYGLQYKYRRCNNPVPNHDGSYCPGLPFATQSCRSSTCPVVNGGWNSWTGWSSCSATCGYGIRHRYRTCNNPLPNYGGRYCSGIPSSTTTCSSSVCSAVHGGWGTWYSWSSCSVTCGDGRRHRYRECNNPVPNFGGRLCSGSPVTTHGCSNTRCGAVNGGWSAWDSWSSCSASCGDGIQHRKRRCDTPVPNYGVSYCLGVHFGTKTCNLRRCAVINGGWSIWNVFGGCSVTCGRGVQHRYRMCNNPLPNNGGSYCSGSAVTSVICNAVKCPVDGLWSLWSNWTSCDYDGLKNRTRECDNPSPMYGGQDCGNTSVEVGVCEMMSVNGQDSQISNSHLTQIVIGVAVGCVVLLVVLIECFCMIKRRSSLRGIKENTPNENYDTLYKHHNTQRLQCFDNKEYVGSETMDKRVVVSSKKEEHHKIYENLSLQ